MSADAAYSRHEYQGGAQKTTITDNPLSSGATTINIASGTNWPTGGTGNFTVTVDPGLATEEAIQCSSRSGTALTVAARGFDGTSAVQHSNGATIIHSDSARDRDEANQLVKATLGTIAAKGDLLAGSAANTLSKLTVGANGYGLYADSTQTTGLRYGLADPGGSAYTPTLTQSATVTKTVTYANYTANGKLVHWNIYLTLTGSGTVANAVLVGLPVTNRASSQIVGNGIYYDVSTTTVYNVAALATSGASTCTLLSSQAGGTAGWGSAPSLAAASGDLIILQGHYWSA